MTVDDEVLRTFAQAFHRLAEEVHRLAPEEAGEPSALTQAIVDHLGAASGDLPVIEQGFPGPDLPNLQLALEEVLAGSEDGRILGLPVELLHWDGFGLANLANPSRSRHGFGPMGSEILPPSYSNQPIDVDATLPCVSLGVWLLRHDGEPVVALMVLGDERRGSSGLSFQVMAHERDRAQAFLADLKDRAHRLNVYRGKVLSFRFEEWGSFGLSFHPRPTVSREDLILPEEDLDAIDRHTTGISAQADRLTAAGRHLKRGLLLYGPPGTGKTYSVEYLCHRMPERTTVLLSGQAAPTLGQAAALARSLAPSMLVLEDVDLVARTRTMQGRSSNPLLFQLLNEMDGLDEDADVIFVLTTNRVELLEPALAGRPGRIDQAVEIGLPDEDCRRRLVARYLSGLDHGDLDLEAVVERTEGVSAAFLKELGRRAALVAAEATPGDDALVVTGAHVEEALDDLLEHSAPVLRASLGLEGPGEPLDGGGRWFDQAGVVPVGYGVGNFEAVETMIVEGDDEDWDDDEP